MNQAEHAHYRVAVALTPVRSEPSERSEQTTQWHLHQKVEVTDFRPGWCSCVGLRDGYRGWVAEGQLEPAGDDPFGGGCTFVLSRWARLQRDSETLWVSHGCAPDSDWQLQEGAMGPSLPATGIRLCETAHLYLGTPYLWGGTSIWGIDCSGLIQQVYAVHGISLPRDAWQQADSGLKFSDPHKAAAGDLAFFSNDQNRITHVGLVLGDGQILHASSWVRIDRLTGDGIERGATRQKTHRLSHFCKIL
ncbi:MAG: NlpC/P60 family protein [Sphingomonadales bacterium]|nr:NlpC/P60 family protein [Sphingomonadales bacterium]